MSKSLAQRVLETLPPKTLSEVVEFIAANGSATNIIVRAGRSQSDAMPVLFWPLDHYSDETDRVNALTALATNGISLDRAVSMYDGGANNYWQELAAMVFGNLSDKEFKDTLEEDLKFDFDDATELSDFLPEDTVDSIKKSVAYQRLSKETQTAIIGSVDYLRQLRLFGEAIRGLAKRQGERSSYLGHYGVEVATPRAFTGDTSPEECYLNCRRLKADVMNQVLPSADPQYTGGFKKFFKKVGKAVKKIAAPVASVFAPALAPVLGLVGGRTSQPSASDATAPISPGVGVSPTVVSSDEFLRVNDPRVVILLEVANRALNSLTRPANAGGFNPAMGDILTPDTSGEGIVALPIIQVPQGDVVITDAGVPVTLDHYAANTDYYNGDFKRNFSRRRRVIGGRAVPVASNLPYSSVSVNLPPQQVLSLISALQQAINTSGYTGDVDSFVGEVEAYFDSVAEGLPYQGSLTKEQINALADRIGNELGLPVLGQVSQIVTANMPDRRQPQGQFTQAKLPTNASPTTLPPIKVVGRAISDTLKGVREAFAAVAGKPRAFSTDSRFMKLGSAVMNAMGDLTEDAPPPSGLSDLAE